MPVTDDKIKVAFLQKVIFDSGKNQGSVAFADFRHNYPNGEAALLTQHTGHRVGAIIQFASGGANASLRLLWNRLGCGRPVHHQRHGCDRQSQMFGQFAEIDALVREILRRVTLIGFGARHGGNGSVVWHRTQRAASHGIVTFAEPAGFFSYRWLLR